MQWREWQQSTPEPVDPSQHRFCPRCNTVTVWDTTGDLRYCCTNFARPGDPDYCGFTLMDELTDAEWRNLEAYDRRINAPQPRQLYQHV